MTWATFFWGEKQSHVFEFTNATAETLVSDEMAGVKKSCQCAGVSISSRQLAPNETSRIEVRVNTAGRVGRFSERVSVKWKGESGRELYSLFELRGISETVFATSHGSVAFTRDDVIAGKRVQVFLRSKGPRVDWKSLSVKPPVDYLEISQITTSENGAFFFLGTNRDKVDAGGVQEVAIHANAITDEASENKDPTNYFGRLVVNTANPGILKIEGKSILLNRSLNEPALLVGSFALEGDLPDEVLFKDAIQILIDDSFGFKVAGITAEKLAKTVVRVSFSLTQESPPSIDSLRIPVTISVQRHLDKEMLLVVPYPVTSRDKG